MASPFTFRTKAKGLWANFTTECQICEGEISVRDGRQERHECQPRRPVTLADIRFALDNRTNN